jgi:hypothetical protein
MNTEDVIHVVVDAMPATDSGWLEWLTALSTPTIAIFAIWIAWQQLHLNRNQFRSDLMEKRVAILSAIRDLLSAALKNRYPDLTELDKFDVEMVEAPFLFGPEVMSYLDKLRQNYIAIWNISEQDKDNDFKDPQERFVGLEKRREYRTWMREQFLASKDIFMPYLDLTTAGVESGKILQTKQEENVEK